MVSVLASRSRGPGSSPGPGHCVVFLGKTLTLTVPFSGTGKFNAGCSPAMDWHPIQWGGGGGE